MVIIENNIASENGGSESVSDMDDNEKNNYLLSNEESRIKTLIWNRMHKEWIDD